MASYQHLQTFTQGHCKLEEVDKKFCEAFKSFLCNLPNSYHRATKLAQNTASCYFAVFKIALKGAYEQELISTKPGSKVRGVGPAAVQREFLHYVDRRGP